MSPCLFLSPAFHSMEKELHVWMEAESRLDGSGGGGAIGTHRVPREGLWEIQKAVSASKPYAKVTRHFSPRCTTCSTSVTISSELFRRRNRSCTRDSSSLCPLDTMVSNQWRNTAEETNENGNIHVIYAEEEAAGTRLLIDGRTCLLQLESKYKEFERIPSSQIVDFPAKLLKGIVEADNQLEGTIPISSGSKPGLDMLLSTEHLTNLFCHIVYTPDGEPLPTNKRYDAAKIFSHPDIVAEETCTNSWAAQAYVMEARLDKGRVLEVLVEVVQGDARNVLCDAVDRHRASALVLGSHS
ncbi:hypothetical protein D0Y65_038998 [Glycine soja]|uniref:Uncharacterized protein n=1 Tax=Glycine soja TaxID=3848 RepID=A0A445H7A4_GLYSO|nr:hypothetical protein D0Y65_038998 [Glycine soja]RZB69466.1 hypothetical protein D0Y65_038998 [Glycine soja]